MASGPWLAAPGLTFRKSLMEDANRAALVFPLPSLDRDSVDAGIAKAVAQIDEIAFARLEVDLDLIVIDSLEFRGGEALVGCRHFGVSECHRHRSKDGGELLVKVARFKIPHLDEVAVRMLAHFITPVPAFRCR